MSLNQFKVLIVDDDFSSRRLLSRHIASKWSVRILEAQEGSEALRLISKERPNLVVLDMVMPFMGGLEVLKVLRANAKLRSIPVVACTSVDDKDTVAQILKSGVDDYVVKPFDKKILLRKLARFISVSPR